MNDCFQKYPMMVVAIVFTTGLAVCGEWAAGLPWWAWGCLLAVAVAAVACLKGRFHGQTVLLLLAFFALGGLRMATDAPSATYGHRPNHANPVRESVVRRMNALFSDAEEEGNIVVAMSMGERANISRDLRADYAASGAAHVLALSGLHIGIVFFLFKILARRRPRRYLSVRQMLAEAVVIAAIWSYVYLVGMPPSAVRAATMVSLYELMSLQYRGRVSLNAIGATAFAMLLIRPADFYNIGFQLSFAAVTSIIILFPLVSGLLPRPANRIVGWTWATLCVSLSAQIGVTPLIAYHFGYVSTYAVLASLVVIPCATAIVSLSVLLLACLYVTPLATAIASPLAWVAGVMNQAVGWIASLPGATIGDVRLSVAQLVAVYLAIACLALLLRRIRKGRDAWRLVHGC